MMASTCFQDGAVHPAADHRLPPSRFTLRQIGTATALVCSSAAWVPSSVLAQAVIVNDGSAQSLISSTVNTNQVEIGSTAGGSGSYTVGTDGILNAAPADPVPVIQLGTLGTGSLSLVGNGQINGFGLNIGSGGTLDLSQADVATGGAPNLLLGSLAGSGTVNVGERTLAIGSDNSSTNFSGTVNLEGPSNTDPHGILAKIGTGTLTLDGATIGGTGPTAEGEFYVLEGAAAQTSGTTALSATVVGLGAGSNAALNVSGDNLNIDTSLTLGSFGGTGTATQTGGTVTFTQGCGDPARCVSLNIGNQGGTGSYTISNGTLNFAGPGFIVLGRSAADATSGTLNIAGGEVNLQQGSLIVGNMLSSAAGTGTLNQTGGTLTVENAANLFLGGGGAGTYTLSGGTLRIGGTSLRHNYQNFAGSYAFNLQGGTVQVYGSALTTDVAATLGGTSTIDTNGLGATWNGVLSGAGGLNKTGDGTLTLGGLNLYTGATTVTQGSLALSSTGSLGLTSMNVAAGASFDLSAVTSPVPLLGGTPVPGVALTALSGAGSVVVGSKVLVVGLDNSDQTFSGKVQLDAEAWDASHGMFVKAGSGTLTIDNATFGHVSSPGGGEIIVGGGGALAQTSGSTTLSSLVLGLGADATADANVGRLTVSGGDLRLDTALTLGSFGGSGSVVQSGGNVSVDHCGDAAHCTAFSIGSQGGSGTYSISAGSLSFTGPGFMVLGRNEGATATAASTGTLNLSGSGQVSVQGGSLIVGNFLGSASLQGSGTINQTGGTLTIANDASLYVGGSGNGTYNLLGGTLQVGGTSLGHHYGGQGGTAAFNLGGGTVQVLGTPLVTDIAATLAAGSTSTIDTNNLGATWSGVLSGDGSLRKIGAGTLELTGANSYAGGTDIDGGVVSAASDANLGAATGALRFNGGTLRLDGDFSPAATRAITTEGGGAQIDTNGHAVTLAQPITGGGALTKAGAGTLVLTGDSSYAGTTTISEGSLQLGDGGATGSVAGNIANNAALVVNRSGSFNYGGVVSGPGSLSLVGPGTTIFTADQGYTGGTTIAAGTLQLGDGGTGGNLVGNVANEGALVFNRADASVFAGVISGAGSVTQAGAGTVTLAAAQSYTGATHVDAGTLKAGVANAFSPSSAHTVAAGATLDTGGFNQQLSALTSAGTVNLLSDVAGSTLTLTGPYVGNGATLRIGTVLGGAGSVSDRLVLDGAAASASGNTTLQVVNRGGLGAPTTGNGIEVVSASNGATTTAQTSKDAFVLQGDAVAASAKAKGALAMQAAHVDAGAYEYRLFAADAAGAGENWYLRSEAAPTPPTPPTPPAPPPVTYRVEAPAFAALPAQLRQGDLAMLGNLHRRVGDETSLAAGDAPATSAPADGAERLARRAWARAVYTDVDIRQQGVLSPHSDGYLNGLQAGIDLWTGPQWQTGLYLGYLEGGADVTGNASGGIRRVGYNDLQSRFIGGYATWMDAAGRYADGVVQWGDHRYSVRPDTAPSASGQANSWTASIEVGQAFPLVSSWTLEPQAQLAYQKGRFDDVAISGAAVQQDADGGWIGRLGLRIKGDVATSVGRVQPYGRANVYFASGGSDVVSFINPAAVTALGSASGYTSLDLAVGATVALSPAVSAYGELGHVFDIGGDARVKSSLQGSIGAKVRW